MLKRWAGWLRKHWAALPQGIRRLVGGIAVVVLAAVAAWVLFVPAADWLAHHDVGSATGSLHETALDNARGRLLTLGAGLFAAGALWFTARSFTLSREGQVTNRYTKAITQLGSKKLDVRIGGIYALERVARDSRTDHPTVMEVLTAFIRVHSPEQWPAAGPATDFRPTQIPKLGPPPRSTRPDVQAAVTVIGRRISRNDREGIDLGGAILIAAILTDADLRGAWLRGAILIGAILGDADLRAADLGDADLRAADLTDADLRGAWLRGADLTGADLTGADLTGAAWPEDTPAPGWERDTSSSSGRLKRAGTDSKPAGAN